MLPYKSPAGNNDRLILSVVKRHFRHLGAGGSGPGPRALLQRLALALFLLYCAVFPGSTVTLALDRVPAWGEWMGAALLAVQGLAVACWLPGRYGRRGLLALAAALALAWCVEHIGETTGLPFGRYRYTEMLQPQILGVVPAPIALAWLMAALGSWQLARLALGGRRPGLDPALVALTGLLVVVLDLQIEPVATLVRPYWVWLDAGPYYGVPLANFAAWWAVGVVMALLVSLALGPSRAPQPADSRPGWLPAVSGHIPALLYLLSSLMFTAVNFAHGYPLAGVVGLSALVAAAIFAARSAARRGEIGQAEETARESSP
nr:MAG: carotenoid biosynthesis protein [Chloroflexota bacterium]